MNNRRSLIIVLGAVPFMPQAAFAQAKQPIVIGWLHFGARNQSMRLIVEFKEGLAALGWKEGMQIVVEERWADGRIELLQGLARDIVSKNPAVIVAAPSQSVAAVARQHPAHRSFMRPAAIRWRLDLQKVSRVPAA